MRHAVEITLFSVGFVDFEEHDFDIDANIRRGGVDANIESLIKFGFGLFEGFED
jgi:hypothetical protein